MTENENAASRYTAALHAMQSGVAMEMNYRAGPAEPKHLRVGVGLALVCHQGLVKLLIDKGVITEAEYLEAMATAMEDERERYEKHLTALIGAEIKLR